MISKFEMIGIGVSVLFMALALYLVRVENSVFVTEENSSQTAAVSQGGVVVVNEGVDEQNERTQAFIKASDSDGNIKNLVVDDIVIGTGEPVKNGDKVTVHYIGTLVGGEEFDNSRKRGEPFTFKVGSGDVIKGWEQGLVGMKVGGQRILVIPPELGYGNQSIASIPANSTLVFAIELLEVN